MFTYCRSTMFTSCRCECPEGMTGGNCDQVITDCRSVPCEQGGTCVEVGGIYGCACPYPYTGPGCRLNSDPCFSSPCLYGGTCYRDSSADAGYSCMCAPGFIGSNCQVGSAVNKWCKVGSAINTLGRGGGRQHNLWGWFCNK